MRKGGKGKGLPTANPGVALIALCRECSWVTTVYLGRFRVPDSGALIIDFGALILPVSVQSVSVLEGSASSPQTPVTLRFERGAARW